MKWVVDEATPRVVYEHPPLALVVAQLTYFSRPLSEQAVTEFQKAIADEYPIPERQEVQPTQVIATGSQVGVQSGAITSQWRIASEDDNWVVTLGERVLSLEVRSYTSFDEFGARFRNVLQALVDTLVVTRGQRLGLRYVNEIRSDILPLEEVLRSELRGLLGFSALIGDLKQSVGLAVFDEGRGKRVNVQHGLLPGGTTVIPLAGTQPDQSRFLLLDVDAYQEFKAPNYLAVTAPTVGEKLEEFHQFVSAFFRWSTSDEYRATLGERQGNE